MADNKGVTFIGGNGLEETLSYKALYNNASHNCYTFTIFCYPRITGFSGLSLN
jgi:hypothetical protein